MTTDLAAFVLGRWQVTKTVHDRSSGRRGAFAGTAMFAAAGERTDLVHVESGTLRWGTHTGPAHRTFHLHPTDDAGVREVHFSDGRYFHRLDLRAGAWSAVHHCGEDTYAGCFAVESANAWSYSWNVTGPCKDLALSTRLTRV